MNMVGVVDAVRLLSLLSLASVTSSRCPSECSCNAADSNRIFVDCRSRSLNDTNIARAMHHLPVAGVIDLDLGGNRGLTSATRTLNFQPRLSVVRLHLEHCRLTGLNRHVFRQVSDLEFIDLSSNAIAYVDAEAFDGLHTLRHLNMSFNLLKTIDPLAFNGLILESLRLDGNDITSIDDKAFIGSSIQSINLDGNKLRTVTSSTFKPLIGSLRSVSIRWNSVPLEVDPSTWSGFTLLNLALSSSGIRNVTFLEDIASVGQLDVGDNPLLGVNGLSVSWSAGLALSCHRAAINDVGLTAIGLPLLLSSLRSVVVLDLSGNGLRSVEPDVFRSVPELTELDLSRNMLTSLLDDFGLHLNRLERLNLSRNSLTTFTEQSLSGLRRLRVLDVSWNHLQVLPESLANSVLPSLERFDVSDNRFHCNCEMAWFRRWIATPAGRLALVKPPNCTSPTLSKKQGQTDMMSRDPDEDFVCSPPTITGITNSVNVQEGGDVLLVCTAQSDPASRVQWTSPSHEVVSISPSDDRQVTRLSAIWQLRRARVTHSGWYICHAINMVGNASAYTYLHVVANKQSGTNGVVDMDGLVFPETPLPHGATKPSTPAATALTSTTPRTASTHTVSHSATTKLTTTTASSHVTTTSSMLTALLPSSTQQTPLGLSAISTRVTTTSDYVIVAATRSNIAQTESTSWYGGIVADSDVIPVVVAAVVVAVVAVAAILTLIFLYLWCRQRKRSGEYDLPRRASRQLSNAFGRCATACGCCLCCSRPPRRIGNDSRQRVVNRISSNGTLLVGVNRQNSSFVDYGGNGQTHVTYVPSSSDRATVIRRLL